MGMKNASTIASGLLLLDPEDLLRYAIGEKDVCPALCEVQLHPKERKERKEAKRSKLPGSIFVTRAKCERTMRQITDTIQLMSIQARKRQKEVDDNHRDTIY